MKRNLLRILILPLLFLTFGIKAETINVGDTITYHSNYTMNQNLTVNGVLIVDGTFEMGSQATLTIGDNATIIVTGDFIAANKVDISTGGVFIIGGNLTIKGAAKGSFNYTGEGKAQVFIGGSVDVKNTSDYPVLIEGTGSHDSSGHNYGDITDLTTEQPEIWEEYKEIICGSGIDPGSITNNQVPLCEQGNPTIILEDQAASTNLSYQWFYSTNSTDPDIDDWTEISGATSINYDPSSILETTHYYRQVKKGNGCVANSNVVSINVYPKPQPMGIFFE